MANTPWAAAHAPDSGAESLSGLHGPQPYPSSGSPHVINMLRTGTPQLTIHVAIAEMSCSAARSLGASFKQVHGQDAAPAPVAIVPSFGEVAYVPNLALRSTGGVHALRESQLVTVQGHAATLVGGGQFPVPVSSGDGADDRHAVNVSLHGAELTFAPSCGDKEHIRLTVTATTTPGVNPRHLTATVALHDGQTFALSGLTPPFPSVDRELHAGSGRTPLVSWFHAAEPSPVCDREVVILIIPEIHYVK